MSTNINALSVSFCVCRDVPLGKLISMFWQNSNKSDNRINYNTFDQGQITVICPVSFCKRSPFFFVSFGV